jgi:hypothetical protein
MLLHDPRKILLGWHGFLPAVAGKACLMYSSGCLLNIYGVLCGLARYLGVVENFFVLNCGRKWEKVYTFTLILG